MQLKKIYIVFIFCSICSLVLNSQVVGIPFLPYFNKPTGVVNYTYTGANKSWIVPNGGYSGIFVTSISQAIALIEAGCCSSYVKTGSTGTSYVAGNTNANGSLKISF